MENSTGYLLSFVISGFRVENWTQLFESISSNVKCNFEVVFCGPNKPPTELLSNNQVVFIQDGGRPSRCMNRAVVAASGNNIVIGISDDEVLVNGSTICEISKQINSDNDIIVFSKTGNTELTTLSNLEVPLRSSIVIASKKHLLTVGLEASFETIAFSIADLLLRDRHANINIIMPNISIVSSIKINTDAVKTVLYAQLDFDSTLFKNVHSSSDSSSRTIVEIDSWKFVPSFWQRRTQIDHLKPIQIIDYKNYDSDHYDISICIPALRPHWWKRLYDSLIKSCQQYTFELIMCAPCDLPIELQGINNIQCIKDFGSPGRAAQIAALHARSSLMSIPVDDGYAMPHAYAQTIEFYRQNCGHKDVICQTYKEGTNFTGTGMPTSYWHYASHGDVRGLRFNDKWMFAMQPMMSTEYFREIGGIDATKYEALAFCLHDLCVRINKDGGKFMLSPCDVMNVDWFGAHGYDHTPVDHATCADRATFKKMYTDPAYDDRIYIDVNNYKEAPEKWARRFK